MVKYFHFHNLRTGDNFDKELEGAQCQHNINGRQCRNRCLIGISTCWIHLLSNYKLRIKQSTIPNAGKGLFALVKNTLENDTRIVFEIGDCICEYNGEVITSYKQIERYHGESAPYSAKLHRQNNIQMYEDAAIKRGIGSLINHSTRNDNCRMSVRRDNTIALIATKRIRNHSEILLNYGRDYKFNVQHTRSETNYKRFSI